MSRTGPRRAMSGRSQRTGTGARRGRHVANRSRRRNRRGNRSRGRSLESVPCPPLRSPDRRRLAQAPLHAVAARLAAAENVECLLSEGSSLAGIRDNTADAVWSFDVFVHIASADKAAYLAEIARVLRPCGDAAIHHADGRNRGVIPSRRGWRAPMTAALFAALAREQGLEVEEQIRHWSGGRHGLDAYHDVISVLRRPARLRAA
jgi:SAM-dependent methyltransferase